MGELGFPIVLESTDTGLTLRAQLFDLATQADVGAVITGTFLEEGNGNYTLQTTVPDNTRLGIRVYENGVPGTILGITVINPEEFGGGGVIGSVEYDYVVTNSITGDPIEGVTVWTTTDEAGIIMVWSGVTDVAGVARDTQNFNKPFLDPGTYYFWSQKSGYVFDNPDTEVVS